MDNDETAAVICELMHARHLVILTSTEGIYRDPADPSSLVREVVYPDAERLTRAVRTLQQGCVGASRAGANGARAKLEFSLAAALKGTTVIIGHAKYRISELLAGNVPHTRIGII